MKAVFGFAGTSSPKEILKIVGEMSLEEFLPILQRSWPTDNRVLEETTQNFKKPARNILE